jgi:hypothetical protein
MPIGAATMLNREKITAIRLLKTGLLRPFRSAEDCAQNLCGIQSQMPQFAEVALFNRCDPKPSTEDLAKRYEQNRLICIWSHRKTLHMHAIDDWYKICNAYSGIKISDETWIVEHEIMKNDLITKESLKQIVQNELGTTDIAILVYLMIRESTINGLMFGRPEKPSIRQFVSYRKILENQWKKDDSARITALNDLIVRYFRQYGLATVKDFCHWSGLTQKSIGEAWPSEKLECMHFDGRNYFMAHDDLDLYCSFLHDYSDDEVFLLGKFDPLFVSYHHKDWIINDEQKKMIWSNAGHIESVILSGTEVIGTWRHSLKGRQMTVQLFPFRKILKSELQQLKEKAEKLAIFWKKELTEVIQ